MLVVQLDSDRLEADGLDLSLFAQAVSLFMPNAETKIVRATSLEVLLQQLADIHGSKFDVIVVIGHSNERGIVLAAGRPLDNWVVFAQYLKPFAPRKLVVVACRAGRALPSRILFSELPTLRRIYATPVLANRLQGQVMLGLLPHILERRIPDRKLLRAIQVGLGLLAGRQLWEWRRTDYERDKDDALSPLINDLIANIGDRLLARFRANP